eukprot:scaffold6226_cov117-Isochrysis_galbana.AAC.6
MVHWPTPRMRSQIQVGSEPLHAHRARCTPVSARSIAPGAIKQATGLSSPPWICPARRTPALPLRPSHPEHLQPSVVYCTGQLWLPSRQCRDYP